MELRGAEPTDAIAVARVHVRSWQAAYRKLMPDYLDQLRPEDQNMGQRFASLLARAGGFTGVRPPAALIFESADHFAFQQNGDLAR
jgi:hypothetical protein